MDLVSRYIPGHPGVLEPAMVNIPVYHMSRRIGTAEINGRGEINIQIEDDFDKQGIFTSFMNGYAKSVTIGMDSPPVVEIRKIINRED